MRARKSNHTNGSEASINVSSSQALAHLSAQQFRSLTSELIDRLQFASGHGLSYDGKRDLYLAGGYPRNLTDRHYEELYERGDIAERLVEALPKATWSPGTSIFENDDPDTVTPWEDSINGLFDRLDIWNEFKRADILAGLGKRGYSVILIGVKGLTSLASPLKSISSLDSIIYLQPLRESRADIKSFVEKSSDPRYGRAEYYTLKLGAPKNRGQRGKVTYTDTRTVHWSRVIHFTEGTLDNKVYGPPRLRSIYNRLMDMEKIYVAGSEAAFKRMDPGAVFNLKEGSELGDTEAEEDKAIEVLQGRIEEFYQGLRRYLLTDNLDTTILQAPVHSFGPNIDSLIKVIAGAKGFPQRKLTGSEEAQLASQQDRSNWQDEVGNRRQLVGESHTREFINRFGVNNPETYEIWWPDKGELNDHEKAELVKTLAAANQSQSLANGDVIYTANEIRDKVGDGPIEESDQEVDNPTILRGNRFMSSKTPLLDRKRAYCSQKGRGIVLVNPYDSRFQARVNDPDEQSAVRRVADKFQPKMERQIIDLWSSTIPESDFDNFRLSMDNLERAQDFAMDLYDAMEVRMQGEIQDRLLEVMGASGEASLRVVDKRGSWSARRKVGRVEREQSTSNQARSLKMDFKFNHTNPRAIKRAQERSSALITEISPSTRSAIRSMIADGLREGKSPRLLAREIKDRIGLRSDQLETLNRFALDHTESQVTQRANRMLRQRAELISRTETLRSSNEGLRETWRQAQDNDLLPMDIQREWIATADDRTRDEHLEIDGEKVGIGEPFSIGVEPGEEPACRCSQGIA